MASPHHSSFVRKGSAVRYTLRKYGLAVLQLVSGGPVGPTPHGRLAKGSARNLNHAERRADPMLAVRTGFPAGRRLAGRESWCGRDEFSYSGLPNPAKWDTKKAMCAITSCNTTRSTASESAGVEDGNLLIELRKETPENFLPHVDQRRMASVYVGQREQLMIF